MARLLYHNFTTKVMNETDSVEFIDNYSAGDSIYKSEYGNACVAPIDTDELKGLLIDWRRSEALDFDDWFAENEGEINIELAESGADREMGFDLEGEFEDRYNQYVDNY